MVKVSATVFNHSRFLFGRLNHETFSAKFRGGFLQNKVILHEVLSLQKCQNKKLFCVFCPLGMLQIANLWFAGRSQRSRRTSALPSSLISAKLSLEKSPQNNLAIS